MERTYRERKWDKNGYEYDLYFSDIDAHTFIYGHSKEYKLNVIKNDGEFLYILKKDEPQMPFTGEMKSKIKDRYERFSESEKDAIKFPEKLPSHSLERQRP